METESPAEIVQAACERVEARLTKRATDAQATYDGEVLKTLSALERFLEDVFVEEPDGSRRREVRQLIDQHEFACQRLLRKFEKVSAQDVLDPVRAARTDLILLGRGV